MGSHWWILKKSPTNGLGSIKGYTKWTRDYRWARLSTGGYCSNQGERLASGDIGRDNEKHRTLDRHWFWHYYLLWGLRKLNNMPPADGGGWNETNSQGCLLLCNVYMGLLCQREADISTFTSRIQCIMFENFNSKFYRIIRNISKWPQICCLLQSTFIAVIPCNLI